MFNLWQNSEEFPFWVQIFLLVFVLIGIFPFFQKILSRIDSFMQELSADEKPGAATPEAGSKVEPGEFYKSEQLNEYEYIVFRRIAMTEGKGLTLKALVDGLHLGRTRVASVLQSLIGRGLVRGVRGMLFGRRYSLTRKGHDYALEQGFIIKLRNSGSPLSS